LKKYDLALAFPIQLLREKLEALEQAAQYLQTSVSHSTSNQSIAGLRMNVITTAQRFGSDQKKNVVNERSDIIKLKCNAQKAPKK
jgi:hypothetical protein